MLAFYGWTDKLLLNLLNTKINCFPAEQADLFVFDLPRVSRSLVKSIEATGAFQNVFWLQERKIRKRHGLGIPFEKLEKLLSGQRQYAFYQEQLRKCCGDTHYSMLFTGAFWSNTLFLFRYFRVVNPNVKISIVEEGTANYNSPKGWQFRCMPTRRLREPLMRLFYFPLTWLWARRAVKQIFLYTLDTIRSDEKIPAVPLPPVDKRNPVCQSVLYGAVEGIDAGEYQSRHVYFLSGPIVPGYEDTFQRTYEIIQKICDCVSEEEVLIKVHPDSVDQPCFTQWDDSRVFVDKRRFLLEGVLSQIDLSEKCLVVRNSSVPMTVAFELLETPCIIFTYRLYESYQIHGERITDQTVRDFQACCPGLHIEVPNTLEDLCKILKTV